MNSRFKILMLLALVLIDAPMAMAADGDPNAQNNGNPGGAGVVNNNQAPDNDQQPEAVQDLLPLGIPAQVNAQAHAVPQPAGPGDAPALPVAPPAPPAVRVPAPAVPGAAPALPGAGAPPAPPRAGASNSDGPAAPPAPPAVRVPAPSSSPPSPASSSSSSPAAEPSAPPALPAGGVGAPAGPVVPPAPRPPVSPTVFAPAAGPGAPPARPSAGPAVPPSASPAVPPAPPAAGAQAAAAKAALISMLEAKIAKHSEDAGTNKNRAAISAVVLVICVAIVLFNCSYDDLSIKQLFSKLDASVAASLRQKIKRARMILAGCGLLGSAAAVGAMYFGCEMCDANKLLEEVKQQKATAQS